MTSMKAYLGTVVIACATGCGIAPAEPETGETEQAVKACDDPLNCVRGNGGGVYTQELGNAGMGPTNFMITHFINNGVRAEVKGRYWDDTSNDYVVGNAEVVRARLDAAVGTLPAGDYQIVSVAETLTTPTFTLANSTLSGPVTGVDLLHLSIALKLSDNDYILSFAGHSIDQRTTSVSGTTTTLQMFDMQWNTGVNVNTATRQSYCTLAPDDNKVVGPDPVVFQQGIIVNALTAVVVRNDNSVTLSCRNGAIATVRWWGYAYRPGELQANAFETAMHMKRASYCGDSTFYTKRNTDVFIRDSAKVNADKDSSGEVAITIPDSNFEASWGWDSTTSTFRALCVNMMYRRRPGVTWPPPQWGGGSDFNGQCADGTSIPLNNCPLPPVDSGNHAPPWWFADQYDAPSE